MGLSSPKVPSDEELSPEQLAQAQFNEANAYWRELYPKLYSALQSLPSTHPFFSSDGYFMPLTNLTGEYSRTVIRKDTGDFYVWLQSKEEGTKKIILSFEPNLLRVLEDGLSVVASPSNPSKSSQPIQPYHGAPIAEEGRAASREVQMWLNPFLVQLATALEIQ